MKSVTVTNHLGESMLIDLTRPEISGLVILYVEGLDPVKADINLDRRALVDGAIFNSASATSRNIVIGFRFYETAEPGIAKLRHRVYKYFPLKRRIKLTFDNGERTAYAYGYVESNEGSIFSKEAGCVVSILCPEAYLYDVVLGLAVIRTSAGLFTFPFSNESLTEPLLIMGDLVLQRENTIYYEGEAPIGFLLSVHVNAAASGLVLTDAKSFGLLGIDSLKLVAFLGSDLTAGDDIYISTVIGKKYARLVREGITYNILDCLLPDPFWFQLEKGLNRYAYALGSGYGNVDFRITFDVAFEGM